ncbi:MAG: hypothetical protein DWI11_06350 [Planctomycetota bacterium]|nr:MAG: hypothetical protein DWI11_06350 [Planctomycetota bacterium]
MLLVLLFLFLFLLLLLILLLILLLLFLQLLQQSMRKFSIRASVGVVHTRRRCTNGIFELLQ